MPRRTFSTAEKIAIAEGWLRARAAGESQSEYAGRHRTSPRRVREFVDEYVVPEPEVRAREIVVAALEELRLLLDQLDAMRGHDDHPERSALPPPSTSATSTRGGLDSADGHRALRVDGRPNDRVVSGAPLHSVKATSTAGAPSGGGTVGMARTTVWDLDAIE